jgi:hypothetical protein
MNVQGTSEPEIPPSMIAAALEEVYTMLCGCWLEMPPLTVTVFGAHRRLLKATSRCLQSRIIRVARGTLQAAPVTACEQELGIDV